MGYGKNKQRLSGEVSTTNAESTSYFRKLPAAIAMANLVVLSLAGVELVTKQAPPECVRQACHDSRLNSLARLIIKSPEQDLRPVAVVLPKPAAVTKPALAPQPLIVRKVAPKLLDTDTSTFKPTSRMTQADSLIRFRTDSLNQHLKVVDASYPQCQKQQKQLRDNNLPVNSDYVVVGINGGRETNTDTCLADLLDWANQSGKLNLYVNTANPGVSNPSQYGWKVAKADIEQRLLPATKAADLSQDPASYGTVWLDVEGANSWQAGSAKAQAQNVKVLEGMAAYFEHVGLNVGIYSANSPGYSMFHSIVGQIPASSNLNGLDNWLGQGNGPNGAIQACHYQPLTAGSHVIMTQYVENNLDQDYVCP